MGADGAADVKAERGDEWAKEVGARECEGGRKGTIRAARITNQQNKSQRLDEVRKT